MPNSYHSVHLIEKAVRESGKSVEDIIELLILLSTLCCPYVPADEGALRPGIAVSILFQQWLPFCDLRFEIYFEFVALFAS